MLVRVCGLLTAGMAVAALLIGLTALTSADNSITGTTSDCRSISPTPTITATPSPTPPFTPYKAIALCNDTASVASDLHIVLSRPSDDGLPVTGNPDGCPAPGYSMTGVGDANYTIDVHWGVACVDPGESVAFNFVAPCSNPGCDSPEIECFNWQVSGLAVPSTSPAVNPETCEPSLVTPTPTPTPLPTSCDARPTPTTTDPPTPYEPPETPSGTNRDVLLASSSTFCNDSGEDATKLRIHFASPYSSRTVSTNAAGCQPPELRPVNHSFDEFDLIVDWGTPCVGPVESLVLSFQYACGGACYDPTPFCYTWFNFEEELDSGGECPLIPSILNWGDINCDRNHSLLDVVDTLRAVQSLTFHRRSGCPDPNARIEIDGEESVWGDFDCDGLFQPKDALVVLMKRASVTFVPGNDCPGIDAQVTVSS